VAGRKNPKDKSDVYLPTPMVDFSRWFKPYLNEYVQQRRVGTEPNVAAWNAIGAAMPADEAGGVHRMFSGHLDGTYTGNDGNAMDGVAEFHRLLATSEKAFQDIISL